MNSRTRALLEAPILPTLLRLGSPKVAVMLAQASVGLIETWFVGQLGNDALVLHSVGVALGFGLLFSVALPGGGRWLYNRMGGSGAALEEALS